MIRINLLPYRQVRQQENIRRQVSVFLLGLVLVGAGLYLGHQTLSNKEQEITRRVQDSKNRLAELKKVTKEIEEIKKKLEITRKKIEIIEDLEKNRKAPVELLTAMTDLVIPQRMWFTSFISTHDQMVITGLSVDQTTVAEFMKRLESSTLFSSVQLKSVKHQTIRNVSLKGFDIACKKKVFQPAEPGETP
jgi:type IV pilus assembly protein PilN